MVTRKQMNKRAKEIEESGEYEVEKAEAFKSELIDEMESMTVEEMDIDFFQGFIDSFTFKDEGEWIADKVEGEIDDIEDQKYQQMKDER